MNISYYLYPNNYNPSIGTFSFNRYLFIQEVPFGQKTLLIYIQYEMLCHFNRHFFIKRYFRYISNMKCYVLSINTFSYIYIWNLNFHKENFNTRIFHFIHFTNEYSPILYYYYNISLYIPMYIQYLMFGFE